MSWEGRRTGETRNLSWQAENKQRIIGPSQGLRVWPALNEAGVVQRLQQEILLLPDNLTRSV